MPRCVICDACNDTQRLTRKFTWSDKNQGYVCSTCNNGIYHDLRGKDPASTIVGLDKEGHLELLELLEDDGVEEFERETLRRFQDEDGDPYT